MLPWPRNWATSTFRSLPYCSNVVRSQEMGDVADFGPEIGEKRSSAQITAHYTLDELVGRQVLAVVNFPPRQIGPVMSEVLVLGVPDAEGEVVLVVPAEDVPLGGRLY